MGSAVALHKFGLHGREYTRIKHPSRCRDVAA